MVLIVPPKSSGSGGGVDEITSVDGTVAVDNPTGPTVDLSVPGMIRNSLTGLTRLAAGLVEINAGDSDLVDFEAGTGQIVDNTSDPQNPTLVTISWAAMVGVAVDGRLTDPATSFYFDLTGTLVQQSGPRNGEDRRMLVYAGTAIHLKNTAIERTVNDGTVAGGNAGMTFDHAAAVGDLNLSGNVYGPNIAPGGTLTLDRTGGDVFGVVVGDAPNPNFVTLLESLNINQELYTYQPVVSGDPFQETNEVEIIPNLWDDGSGTLQVVPPNKYTIQRLVLEPRTGINIIEFGQILYNSQGAAFVGINANNILPNPALRGFLLRGWMIVKEGATDTGDTLEVIFFENISQQPSGSPPALAIDILSVPVLAVGGLLTVGPRLFRYRVPQAGTIVKVQTTVGITSSGANSGVIVDVNNNGTTIFTDQNDRPVIANGSIEGNTTSIDLPLVAVDDEITWDIDQVGDGDDPGEALLIAIHIEVDP